MTEEQVFKIAAVPIKALPMAEWKRLKDEFNVEIKRNPERGRMFDIFMFDMHDYHEVKKYIHYRANKKSQTGDALSSK